MKMWRRLIYLSLFTSLLLGCEDIPTSGSVTITPSAISSREQHTTTGIELHIVSGDVRVQRSGSAQSEQAIVGMPLSANDTIQLDIEAKAVIRCLDHRLWYVPQQSYTFMTDDCPSARPDLNMIVVRQGSVQLKILGDTDFHLVAPNSFARRGDEILVPSTAEVYVLCGTGVEWHDVPHDQPVDVAEGCPQDGECILCEQYAHIPVPRAGLDPLIPYIITPRSTELLTTTPLLRWNPVAGAIEYTVSIQGGGLDWQATTSEPQLRYPGTPALVAGEVYLLKVEADNGRSSTEEGTARLGFVLLDEQTVEPIQAQLDGVAQLDLPVDSRAIYQSIIYANANLIAEAITELEGVVQSSPQLTIYRLLGDLYLRIGLPLEAEQAYQAGLATGGDLTDLRGTAGIYAGLGSTYSMLGRLEEAITSLQQAQQLYEDTGELALATVVEAQWRDLEE